MTCSRNIKLLPPEIISNLRSCVAISSVSQCVEELVLNAVDSCAKNIAVRLDLTFFKIQVVDNGFGIPYDQLDHIGERYHTSKCHGVDDLKNLRFNGFRGEALASLRDICAVLEITSRTQDNRTFFKAFHYGKSTEVRLSVDERPSVGTTVTILDFMYNLPVRRKSICNFRDFEHTRRSLECIALVNPNVSFTLRNNQTGETCLNTRRTNSMVNSFMYLFGCDKTLKEIVYNSEGMKVQGFISTDSHSTNDLQFLFVNCRLILKTRLHELVRLVLAKYLNSKPRELGQSVTTDGSASPRKAGNPVFALNILCPLNEYDICFEPRKTLIEFEDWDKVTGMMKDVLRTFLQDEDYRYEDEDKYLKGSAASVQALNSEANVADIDTSNSKNALFSLVIRRPKPKVCKPKRCSTVASDFNLNINNSKKDKSIVDRELPANRNTSAVFNHRDVKERNSVTLEKTYPFSVGRGYDDNKPAVGDLPVPFTQKNLEHTYTSYSNPHLRTGLCSGTGNAVGLSRSSNTSHFPISLPFSSKPSSLSALKNRKRKESKQQELRETYSFQKQVKREKIISNPRSKNNVLSSEEQSFYKNYETDQKTIFSKDYNRQPASSFHIYSSASDSMPFSDLDVHMDTEGTYSFCDEKSNVSNVQKPAEDKWSILSQSQEIINATEPFLVSQPLSMESRHENDDSDKNTSDKIENSSTDQDLLQFLDSRLPCNGGYNKSESKSSQCDPSVSHSEATFRYDSLYSRNQKESEHPQKQSEVFNSSASGASATNNFNSTSELLGHSTTNKNQCGDICNAFPKVKEILDADKNMLSDQQSWIQWQDLDSGNILYINKITGNTSYLPPPTCVQSLSPNVHKQRTDGHFFLSHNSTPFLPRPDRKASILDENTSGGSRNMHEMLETWQNPVFKKTDFREISSASHFTSKPAIRVYSIVQNYKFFKNMFDKVKMLGQVDNKFIACMVPSFDGNKDANLLVLFDQHAVHERIRLEQFTKELHNENGDVHKTSLEVPLRLDFAPEHVRLARVYSSQLEKIIGLGIEMDPNPCLTTLTFRRVPTCLSERETRELENNRPSVLASLSQCLLEEELDRMKETGSLGGAIPKTLHNVLSSRACKGAIKFGDSLTKEESVQLVKHLSSCQLPFQCAHGRPSVIPVLDVTHITRPLHWKVQRPRLFRLSVIKREQVM